MCRVGVVDSDHSTLMAVSCALEAEGYKVTTYASGQSALGGLIGNPADLAILAMQLPGLDGFEILRRLHETCDIPVILLTSKQDEIDEALGLRMGADDIIHKPFSPQVLAQRVKTVLNRLAQARVNQKENAAVRGAAIECGEIRFDAAR